MRCRHSLADVSLFQPGVTGSPMLTGKVALIATAVDDRGVVGVQFRLDGQAIGPEVNRADPRAEGSLHKVPAPLELGRRAGWIPYPDRPPPETEPETR